MPLFKKARGALIAIAVLFVIGIGAVVARLSLRQTGRVPVGDSVWLLACNAEFTARREGSRIRLALPNDTRYIRVFGEDISSPNLRIERVRGRKQGQGQVAAVAYRAGAAKLRAEFDLHLSPQGNLWGAPTQPVLAPDDRNRYLADEPDLQIADEAVAAALRPLRDRKPNVVELAELIFEHCNGEITFDPEEPDQSAAEVLRDRRGNALGRARAMVALCRAARIPARLVAGFIVEQRRTVTPHVWVESYLGGKWEPYDLEFGHARQLPANYLPVRRGGHAIVGLQDGDDLQVTWELERRPTPRGLLGNGERSPLELFDLARLPLVTQQSLIVLLLLPMGALITTFFRNVVGVRTFGVFSPTLLALAAVYAEWRTVAIIFVLVILIGIGGRALLPGFKLMQVPRLSIVFTLVALSMMVAVSALDYFGWNPTGHIALLPMVVLTSLVDRVYTVADDDGLHVAGVRLAWTIAVSALCFAMLLWTTLGRVLLQFPELHFVTIAAMLLFGIYAGKRLSDLPWFAFLGEPESEKKPKAESAKKSDTAPEKSAETTSPATETRDD